MAPRRTNTKKKPKPLPSPTAVIEAQLSPSGEPVLGLYLHVAYHSVMATFGTIVGRGTVTPAIIGAVTLIAEHPGISQSELARLIGLERATVGATVLRAIAGGLIRRDVASHDARRYVLGLTPAGHKMLAALRHRIATHEAHVASHLTPAERRQLRRLLHKLVYGKPQLREP